MSGAVYYRVRELAERWRISQGKVRLIIRKGELPEVCRRKAVAVNE